MRKIDLKNCLEYTELAYHKSEKIKDMKYIDYFKTKKDIEGYVGVNKNDELIIAFLGTNSVKDIITDIRFFKKRLHPCHFGFFNRIHKGFANAFDEELKTIINRFLIEFISFKKILVVGHSLGAAMATLAALYISYYNGACDYDLTCVISGSPRIGNCTFSRFYNKHVPNTYRIVNGSDIVTKLPPFWLIYKHVGKLIQIGKRSWKFWEKNHSIYKYIYNIGEYNV